MGKQNVKAESQFFFWAPKKTTGSLTQDGLETVKIAEGQR